MGGEHRLDLWMFASPLVPGGFAVSENLQVFRLLAVACLEFQGSVE
jgi:hypothetical protein